MYMLKFMRVQVRSANSRQIRQISSILFLLFSLRRGQGRRGAVQKNLHFSGHVRYWGGGCKFLLWGKNANFLKFFDLNNLYLYTYYIHTKKTFIFAHMSVKVTHENPYKSAKKGNIYQFYI